MSWLSEFISKPLKGLTNLASIGSVVVPGLGAAGILGKGAMAGKVAQGLSKVGAVTGALGAMSGAKSAGNAYDRSLADYQNMIGGGGGLSELTPQEQTLIMGNADAKASDLAGRYLASNMAAGSRAGTYDPRQPVGGDSLLQARLRREGRIAGLQLGDERYRSRLGAQGNMLGYRQTDAQNTGKSLSQTISDILAGRASETQQTGLDNTGLNPPAVIQNAAPQYATGGAIEQPTGRMPTVPYPGLIDPLSNTWNF